MRSKRFFIIIMMAVFAIGLLVLFAACKANQDTNVSETSYKKSFEAPGKVSIDAKSNVDIVNAISAPGVYVEEIPDYNRPIFGVETAVAGFIGVTERGPLEPQLITSFSQFKDIFGEYYGDSYLAYSVQGFFENQGRKLYVARVTSQDAQTAKRDLTDGEKILASIEAISQGLWGNRISVVISSGTNSTDNDPTFKLEVKYNDNFSLSKTLARNTKQGKSTARISEVFENVSLSDLSHYSYNKTVNSKSKLVKIDVKSLVNRSVPLNDKEATFLTGGNDGSPIQLSDYIGDSGQNGQPPKGLSALGNIDEITILYSPNALEVPGLNQAMINQCENLQDRFVIIDTAMGDNGYELADNHNSSYAAIYSPWLQIQDSNKNSKLVPPGGYIAGTYFNNDNQGGVHKAPANISIQGVTSLERNIDKNEQSNYLYKKVNPIVNISYRGIVAYGTRTLSDDPEYKYIPIRRYVNYIRESISEGLQWAEYEVYSPAMESSIKTNVTNFLNNEWQKGALMGTSPREAYYISIYQMNKPGENDDNITVIEVGLALLRPAEFHIVRLSI